MDAPALPLSPDFVEARRRVWVALSDLFRDTVLLPDEARQIARVLHEADLTPDAAETILLNEVAPVFFLNLYSVAGNWTGWADLDVEAMVTSFLTTRPGFGIMRKVQLSQARRVVRDRTEWAAVKTALAALWVG